MKKFSIKIIIFIKNSQHVTRIHFNDLSQCRVIRIKIQCATFNVKVIFNRLQRCSQELPTYEFKPKKNQIQIDLKLTRDPFN